jgi:hypothetical protein
MDGLKPMETVEKSGRIDVPVVDIRHAWARGRRRRGGNTSGGGQHLGGAHFL